MSVVIPKTRLHDYVGYRCEPSPWHRVTLEQVIAFADVTLDHHCIDGANVRAARTHAGGSIAQGFLTLSMLAHFAESFSVIVEGLTMAMNYGFDRIRFLAPVPVGAEIRAKACIQGVTEKRPGQYLIEYDVDIEIRGEQRPAMRARWIAMIFVG